MSLIATFALPIQDSAAAPLEVAWRPLQEGDIEQVLEIEKQAYSHPWTHGNFADALRSAYPAQMLCAGPNVLGYVVAMKGVEEVHLLNLTVAPDFQRQGWARLMMEGLVLWSRGQGALKLWLEVRVSNQRALEVYRRFGFVPMGVRKQYYPLAPNRREDAVVMSLKL
ncbi:MAG: ribosomal-protein-alanine N-acetyltransferase [Betaproteobacteria bacterium]|nr:ribosomal-protein-alanine N-acetyltransferase [Betaproteobacteria bacterium]NBY71559.1 ribosomal-protein-alanine N-acetyltransferase [Betaproteobacteria bacterium]NDD14041.1 ribosomal-protein-alanine N-acetyltransferase [Betaproteobacteria bacterium]